MLFRRYSTKPTPKPIPTRSQSLLTSGSAVGRRSLNLVARRQPFRASTAQTVEIEPFASETELRDILPVPSRPASPLQLPPGNIGPRRQQTRRDTQGTLCSTPIEEHVPPQPPNVITTSPVSQTSKPRTSPTRPRRRGGAGRSASTPKSATRSDSSSPPYEAASPFEGMHAGLWPIYNKVSQEFDEKRLGKWDRDLDTLLIFSSLWSAVTTSLLIRSLDGLEPNYQQQTVLLLHQLLNGRDPNIPDPTIPTEPAGLAIAVNSLWCTSITISVCATIYAMSLKWWLAEYGHGIGPVGGLRRACWRHMEFKIFERSNVHIFIALLPGLLLCSINVFTFGCTLYFWQLNKMVMACYAFVAGSLLTAYMLTFTLPSVANLPLFHYSTFISYQPSSIIGRVTISVVVGFLHICWCALRYLTGSMLFPVIQIFFGTENLLRWYERIKKKSSEGRGHTFVQPATAPPSHSDDFDTGQETQAEAILWLSQVPLDSPESNKALVSSLAMIPSSHPYGHFQKPVVELANLVLDAWLCEEGGQDQTDTAIDCVLVLGNAKFQSAVDRNLDCDHNIGGIPVHPAVAWVAQWLTIDAFQAKFNTPHSEGIRTRLLTATAWLSPVEEAGDVGRDGWELEIQDRQEFIGEIRAMLEQHVRTDNPINNEVLIDLIHGMHASIPRGDPNNASSIIPFFSIFCENHDSPWSKDEAVVRALITYALDLLSSSERKPLVDRKITFDDLVSELIDALMANTTHPDVVTFAFWLACRVPYEFGSRETVLADIAYIWRRTDEGIQEDHRERLRLHATDAFIAVAPHYAVANNGLSMLTDYTALKWLSAAIENRYNQSMTIYTTAMILNLGTSIQPTPITNDIEVGSIIDALFSGSGDPEMGVAEEDVVDTRIYSTLILLKLSPTVELDVERVTGLIVQMEQMIGDPSVSDPGVAKGVAECSEVGAGVDLDRERWKAVYLLALLFKSLPGDEREKHVEGLWARVRVLLGSGELSFMGDYGLCLEPLGMDVSELGTPPADQQDQTNTVFEKWIGGFPLLRLAGAEGEPPPGLKRNRPSLLNPKRWFG